MEDQLITLSKTIPLRVVASKATIFSTLVLGVAVALNLIFDVYIQILFPDRPVVPDLLFVITPYLKGAQYLADIAFVVGVVCFTGYAFYKRPAMVPYYVTAVGLGYLLRGVIIPLTPLGNPLGNGASFGVFPSFIQNSMFPSGHTLILSLLFLLTDKKFIRFKLFMGALVLVEIAALILSRGHYTIDIIGGLMGAYIIHDVCQKQVQKFMLNLANSGRRSQRF
jgi:membrane-associated phospholipid phosphatase